MLKNTLSKAILCLLLLAGTLPAAAQGRYQNRHHDTDNDNSSTKNDSSDNIFKNNSKFDPRKLVYGGYANASFDQYGDAILEASPLIGYRFTDRFQAGVGGTYIYSKMIYQVVDPVNPVNVINVPVVTSIYGGRIYGQYDIFKDLLTGNDRIFTHAEVEALNVSYFPDGNPYANSQRAWIGNYFIGGGYRQALGRRSFINLAVLYNLNYNVNRDRSPYSSPWVFRIGFVL